MTAKTTLNSMCMISQRMIWPGFPDAENLSRSFTIGVDENPFVFRFCWRATLRLQSTDMCYMWCGHRFPRCCGNQYISLLSGTGILCSSNHMGWDMQSTYIQLGSESSNLINSKYCKAVNITANILIN